MTLLNSMNVFLKLRNNIVLDSDLQLAEREITNLFEECKPVYWGDADINNAIPRNHIQSNTRVDGKIGYWVSNNRISYYKIVKYLSFIQEIWTTERIIESEYTMSIDGVYCTIPMMAMSEILFFTKEPNKEAFNKIIEALCTGTDSNKDITQAIRRVKTSSSHVHSFHTYKAKFFPRFVRSLIVSNANLDIDNQTICDPFVGSGTTLIESALMGFNSIGIDVDSLSCFISSVKCNSLHIEDNINRSDITRISASGKNNYTFPNEIIKKFQRWDKLGEMSEYQTEISSILNRIDQLDSPYKDLLMISLSDALTRKFNVRMMGTGSGRFALEIGKTGLSSLILSDLRNVVKALNTISILKSEYHLNIERSVVVNGNAIKRTIPDNSVDMIITSPPYIPASSGREDYLVGKLTSMKALGLYSESSFDACAQSSVGSMSAKSDDLDEMPSSVVDLYNWLINDDLRNIKAQPIIAYYKSIKAALKEDRRTIKDNGKIIYIIGKETLFYNSATKEVLYRVACDEIFIEIANSVGLRVEEVINIELDKRDNIARPRGTDKYYECAIIMTRA